MKINEVVYYCLDAIKAFSDDSYVNEDHVLFLLNKYRGSLLNKLYSTKNNVADSNYQTICLTLENNMCVPYINNPKLVSIEQVPNTMSIGHPSVLLSNGMENEVIEYIPYSRLKAVCWNKYKKNFVYAAISPDNYLYITSTNPQVQYLEQIKFKGIFEDFIKAAELDCCNCNCDIMEKEFPLEVALIPDLITLVVKEILGVAWRPADFQNNAKDDLADLAYFIRKNMKSDLSKKIEGEE